MKQKKRILVAPLDWGLGHATRCIPIIHHLIKHDFEVVISTNGRSYELLKSEFPKLEFCHIKGYNISYSNSNNMAIKILVQIPKIILGIIKEHYSLRKIIYSKKIDGVISDNRFGMWNKSTPCVFMTHQINIKSPVFSKLIKKINHFFISKYNECWIPDFDNNLLSGDLSKIDFKNDTFKFIGPLSRLEKRDLILKYKYCFLISSPEPQRTILESIAKKELEKIKEKSVIILGKTEENKTEKYGIHTIYSHLKSEKLNKILLESEIIISRSGYTTIMDLYKLRKKAILIPTPGQTEQQYLAKYLEEKSIFLSRIQENFCIASAYLKSENFSGFNNNIKSEIKWMELFKIFEE